jgi:ribosome biogenesis protein YTM1
LVSRDIFLYVASDKTSDKPLIRCIGFFRTAQPVPFDFVVNDQLLRTSVKNFIDSHGLSTESVLEIEYLESVLPPKFVQSLEHDDWISDLSISKQGSVENSSIS